MPVKKSQAFYVILLLLGLTSGSALGDSSVVHYHYKVVGEYPHPPSFFTQGLAFYNGLLYQGSGRFGASKIQIRSIDSIEPLHTKKIRRRYFGEGITVLNDTVYQLTWRSGKGFIYNAEDLTPRGTFSIHTQGWGLTNNDEQLIYSDGSHLLRFLNTDDFSVERALSVSLDGKPLTNLNELEWIEGLIYANVWHSHWIVIIDPNNGKVIAKVDLTKLLPHALRSSKTDVLNGIAYDTKTERLYVTGKYWPRLFHIELLENPTN